MLERRTELVESGRVCTNPIIDTLFRICQCDQRARTAKLLHDSPLISIRILKLVQNDYRIASSNQLADSLASLKKFGNMTGKQVEPYATLDLRLPK